MPTGAQLAAAALAGKPVFTLCGDHTNPLLEALDDAGARIIDTRDERGAAWMAAGWALGAGEPGVVVVSNTPALLNAATALADADASGVPVLCITGGVDQADRGAGHPGDADQVAIAQPWTRFAARAQHANEAGAVVERALDQIRGSRWGKGNGRPGAAVVELPMDVQHAAAGDPELFMITLERRGPDPARIAAAREALASARRPVVIAGSGCAWSGAGEALRALVEGARIPVFTTKAARGLIPDDHELCFGFPNLMAEPAQLMFGEADVVLVAGTKLDLTLAGGAFNAACTTLRIDTDPGAFQHGRAADIALHADARDVLEHLIDGIEPLPTDEWVKRLREAADARDATIAARASLPGSPLHPGRLIAEVARALPREAIVTVDAGELALWAIEGIPAYAPSSFHASSFSALGALGMGLPQAIGLKVAQPHRSVVAICGDGSFGFTALEIETAVRHGIAVAVVVGNDGGWGIVRHLQQRLHGRAMASDLPRAPYEVIATFGGALGDHVATPEALQIAIANALATSTPSVINAELDAGVRHDALALIAAMFEAKRTSG